MPEDLPPLQKGNTPTFLETDFANKVLALLRSIAQMTVSPAGAGTFTANQQNAVLDLSGLVARVNAVALAVQQQTPPQLADILNRLKTLENAVTNLSNAVTTINNRLDGASGTGTVTCNPDGSFTVSITINI